jgi:glycerol-3-phosphate dehydrogenase
LQTVYPTRAQATLHRLLRAYGTCVATLLGPPGETDPLGRIFGADLSAAEVTYLARAEWAMTAADIVWRRSKLGLRLTAQQIAQVDAFLAELHARGEKVA